MTLSKPVELISAPIFCVTNLCLNDVFSFVQQSNDSFSETLLAWLLLITTLAVYTTTEVHIHTHLYFESDLEDVDSI